MKAETTGNRGTLFTFYELAGMPTNIYLINANEHIFIVDTFLGPASLKDIKQYILQNFPKKNIIIFNTHFHWDHIWGNCAFPSANIIAHSKCRINIEKYGQQELDKFKRYKQGEVTLVYPHITFEDKITYHNDKIELFYTPGHSDCSASLYDREDKVLYAGDNIEAPIPYFCNDDFDTYIKTLEKYLDMDFDVLLAGHCETANRKLLENNLKYVKDFKAGNYSPYEQGEYKTIHLTNMKTLNLIK